ncbi:hypothetical protein ES319_A11G255500v1 [Gossypium barbadense]|uniref:Uncharacterized protein n=2 Tax=Gossypium TaxID=3633 RepID=A0A5J5TSG9_GOSBA|nr:hypothetical protein ES319_A11G255500v1 [Gossypium barbadense]TYG95575.1 hypothetical protein ES288_A11G278900v1 [Gossypium darwinii]
MMRLRSWSVFRGSTKKGGQPFTVSVKWRQEGPNLGCWSCRRSTWVTEDEYGALGEIRVKLG